MELLKKYWWVLALVAVAIFGLFTETGKGLVTKGKTLMGF